MGKRPKIKTANRVEPKCYAYTTPGVKEHEGWTKIGYTERDVETRIREQTHTVGVTHKTWWAKLAMYTEAPIEPFTDRDFHAYLRKLGVKQEKSHEWFQIDPMEAKNDYRDFQENHGVVQGSQGKATTPYKLREEQEEAVKRAYDYFRTHEKGEFLWNCKPRFGKTLAAYDLCRRMEAKNVLIVTNRPAIGNSWYDDFETFFGSQSGYAFISTADSIGKKADVMDYSQYIYNASRYKGIIEFVSLQNLKGSRYFGGQHRDKLKELLSFTWDILIIDEAHEGVDTIKTDIAFSQIKRRATLHLSGTPFKAIAREKFPDEAIFNWTYADEQAKKRDWDDSREEENPYAVLPQLSMFTYKMSDIVRDKVHKGIELADREIKEYAFDLNEFFRTKDNGKFEYDDDVDRFLDALTKQEKFPFSTPELRNELKHTFWLLDRVDSARALAKKLRVHPVFCDYHVVLAAGNGKIDNMGETSKSFDRVRDAIEHYDKTITLSVGQLTTGVTIPEWTAVLMLSNMKSPAQYMQAAFRAQNPYIYRENGVTYRKENAYVFDFDPARTLTIYEEFANDLIPETAGENGTEEEHKHNVYELLNFFPVYGEDNNGEMIELDASQVLTIPRHIHAKEVVSRGFMSNFLFANIKGIFNAPKEVIDLISNMQALEEPKRLEHVDIDENIREELSLNEDNDVEVSDELVIGVEKETFGDKVFRKIGEKLDDVEESLKQDTNLRSASRDRQLQELKKKFSDSVSDSLIERAKDEFGKDLRKSTQRRLEYEIHNQTNDVINNEFGNYMAQDNALMSEKDEKIRAAQAENAPMSEITKIQNDFDRKQEEAYNSMVSRVKNRVQNDGAVEKAGKTIVKTVETEKRTRDKESIEMSVRDHLRGFSRTIPAFLMAYGTKDTKLENFDSLVPEDVFWEVTVNPQTGEGVSLDQFRFLRDGGDYIADDGSTKHYEGHLFDAVVFDDAVKEFMRKREELADYFDPAQKEDIFEYIPPQRTNQIFTPRAVVKEMADMLEKENPGCFDDPDATFADLYMKSGMYITEIVTRLYQSDQLKALYPDNTERLNHIFAEQVYGCAPTEIIYRICRRYILGFSNEIHIEKDNIRLCDTLKYAKEGTLREKLEEIFDMQK